MKKVFLFVSIAMISVFSAKAQDNASGFHFGGGVRLAMPIGDYSDFYTFGVGAELQGEYMFTEKVSATATAGYVHFLAKEFAGVKGDGTGLIPVLAGVRVYPSTNIFIGARAGVGILTGGGSSTSGFSYEPQVGYNGEKFQVALGYNGVSVESTTFSHIALSAIFKFN